MKALIIGEVLQGILLGIYSTEPHRSRAMDILLAARNYYETGVEPVTDGTLLHADTWGIIKREMDTIQANLEEKHNARVEAARQAANARWGNRNANVCERIRTHTNASNRNANRCEPMRTDAIEENRREINTKEKENKEKERYIGFIGDLKKSVESMGVCADPVDLAMRITNQTSALARRTYGALLHKLGHETFSEVCYTLQSEIKAGEIPDNLGATLTHRLQQQLT